MGAESPPPAEWRTDPRCRPDPRRRRDSRIALELGYKIDTLTAVMFAMVAVVSTLIFIFSLGYMKDETEETVEDHEVEAADPTPNPLPKGRAGNQIRPLPSKGRGMGGQVMATSTAAGGSAGSSFTCRCSASRCSIC